MTIKPMFCAGEGDSKAVGRGHPSSPSPPSWLAMEGGGGGALGAQRMPRKRTAIAVTSASAPRPGPAGRLLELFPAAPLARIAAALEGAAGDEHRAVEWLVEQRAGGDHGAAAASPRSACLPEPSAPQGAPAAAASEGGVPPIMRYPVAPQPNLAVRSPGVMFRYCLALT